MNRRLRVLVFVDYFLPGFKAGGPPVSISRFLEQRHHDVEFLVFTRDRDLGDSIQYEGIQPNSWNERSGYKVFYASPDQVNGKTIRSIIRTVRPDAIYLNSFFSKLSRSVLLLRWLRLIDAPAVTLATRGEFSRGALSLKSHRKRIYIKLTGLLKIDAGIRWHASTEYEERDIRRLVGVAAKTIVVAPDAIMCSQDKVDLLKPVKIPYQVRFVFLSRISPMKNLLGAIEMLGKLVGTITFTIYGPKEDLDYWEKCQAKIRDLPENITVLDRGSLSPEKVHTAFADEHFFLFPTQGENFGHVIAEALAAGCPAILSDTTPWMDLEKLGAGWVTPLAAAERWRYVLQEAVDMNSDEYAKASHSAINIIHELSNAQLSLGSRHALF